MTIAVPTPPPPSHTTADRRSRRRVGENWLTEAPLDEWRGVEMDDRGGVAGLDLCASNLRGTLPAELGSMMRRIRGCLSAALVTVAGSFGCGHGGTPETWSMEADSLSGGIPSETGRLSNRGYGHYMGTMPGVATAAARSRSLLLWGGVDAEGKPYLDPAFVITAQPALPGSTGAYRIGGSTATSGELFSLSFTMPEVADGDGSSSFVFVLPVQSGWAEALASITLTGPGGSATIDADTDLPMAILLDPSTGQVRGILRDLPQADAAALAPPVGPYSLDVLFSRGIPDAAAWSR